MAKTWLITGSSRGLGRELARAVLGDGDNLVATARQAWAARRVAAHYGGRIRPVALDVTDPAAAREAVRTAVAEFGSVNVVVNNAGYATSAAIEDMPEKEFRAQLETNLFGVVDVDQGGPAGAPRAALGAHHPDLVHRGPGRRHSGDGRLPDGQVRAGGIFRGPQQRGPAAGHQGHHRRARRVRTDCTVVHADADGQRGLRAAAGEMHRYRRRWTTSARRPGPGRQIITEIARLAQPPLRLLLGSDALRVAGESARAREAEAAEWAPVSRSADFGASRLTGHRFSPAGQPAQVAELLADLAVGLAVRETSSPTRSQSRWRPPREAGRR